MDKIEEEYGMLGVASILMLVIVALMAVFMFMINFPIAALSTMIFVISSFATYGVYILLRMLWRNI